MPLARKVCDEVRTDPRQFDRLAALARRFYEGDFTGFVDAVARSDLPPPGAQLRMLTARATTNPRISSDVSDCKAISSFAQWTNGITSVGLNAVEFVNPR